MLNLLGIPATGPVLAGSVGIEPARPMPTYSMSHVVAGIPGSVPGFTLVTADFNHDDRPDIAVITFTYDPATDTFNHGSVTVCLQTKTGEFPRSGTYPVNSRTGIKGVWGENMFAGDLNGDGHPDIVTDDFGGSDLVAFFGRGDGTFREAQPLGVAAGERRFAIADIVHDHSPDIVVGNGRNGFVIYRGLGDGTFEFDSELFTAAGTVESVLPVERVIRGRPSSAVDLVVTTASNSKRSIEVFRDIRNGVQGEPVVTSTSLPAMRSRAALVADLNGDGRMDYVGLDRDNAVVQVLLGSEDGHFVRRGAYAVGADAGSVFVGDVNDDGISDLLVDSSWLQNSARPVSVLIGNGDGSFQAARLFGSGLGLARTVRVADMDGDGRADLVSVFLKSNTDVNPNLSVVLGRNTGSSLNSGQRYLISVQAESGQATILESSLNLFQWDAIATNTVPAGQLWRINHASTGDGQRFYRTRNP